MGGLLKVPRQTSSQEGGPKDTLPPSPNMKSVIWRLLSIPRVGYTSLDSRKVFWTFLSTFRVSGMVFWLQICSWYNQIAWWDNQTLWRCLSGYFKTQNIADFSQLLVKCTLFKKLRLAKDRTILSRIPDMLLSRGNNIIYRPEKKTDTTWIDSKFHEKLISEVLFCIWPLQMHLFPAFWIIYL